MHNLGKLPLDPSAVARMPHHYTKFWKNPCSEFSDTDVTDVLTYQHTQSVGSGVVVLPIDTNVMKKKYVML